MQEQRESHHQAAYRILQYLKESSGKGILFKRNGRLTLEAYTNVDSASSLVDKISTTGYCTFLGVKLSDMEKQKQNLVA